MQSFRLKTMIIVLVVCFILIGCTPIDLFYNPLPDHIQTIPNTVQWVFETYNYQVDTDGDWKTVTRTIEDGGGDCEDLVILTLWIVRERFYIEGQMVIRTLHSTGALHATVLFDDEHYDPTTGAQIWPPEDMIVMILDYDEVMQAVRWY